MNSDNRFDRNLTLRVCNQAIYPLWAMFLVGGGLLVVAFALFLSSGSESDEVQASVLAMSGFVLCLVSGLRITYLKYASEYNVTHDAITARYGLISRTSRQIRVNHVRSISVTQTLLGRLLGYGDLEFASAGTNDDMIIFKSIHRPMSTKDIISAILDSASNNNHD